jgi:peptidoglycan hydrolase CwlO-like protein
MENITSKKSELESRSESLTSEIGLISNKLSEEKSHHQKLTSEIQQKDSEIVQLNADLKA